MKPLVGVIMGSRSDWSTMSHATETLSALGIPADHHYVTEGRPFYVTKDGKGTAIEGMVA